MRTQKKEGGGQIELRQDVEQVHGAAGVLVLDDLLGQDESIERFVDLHAWELRSGHKLRHCDVRSHVSQCTLQRSTDAHSAARRERAQHSTAQHGRARAPSRLKRVVV